MSLSAKCLLSEVELAHLLLPESCDVCPDFVFKGRECVGRWGVSCPHGTRHYYAPRKIKMEDAEAIDNAFLVHCDGLFVSQSFKRYLMNAKYDDLFETNNRT